MRRPAPLLVCTWLSEGENKKTSPRGLVFFIIWSDLVFESEGGDHGQVIRGGGGDPLGVAGVGRLNADLLRLDQLAVETLGVDDVVELNGGELAARLGIGRPGVAFVVGQVVEAV